MLTHNFKQKLVGPRTRGTRLMATLQRLQEVKKLYKKEWKAPRYTHLAKHTRKQLSKSVWSISKTEIYKATIKIIKISKSVNDF